MLLTKLNRAFRRWSFSNRALRKEILRERCRSVLQANLSA